MASLPSVLELFQKRQKFSKRISIKSVVLTGGGSKIFGIKEVCERIFNRKTRISGNIINNNLFGDRPEFSTLLGMINLVKDSKFQNQISSSSNILSKIVDKFDNWIEESYV